MTEVEKFVNWAGLDPDILNRYKKHLDEELEKELSKPLITMDILEEMGITYIDWPVIIVDVTHQVRINDVDFDMGFYAKDEDTWENDHYYKEENYRFLYDNQELLNSIMSRVYDPVIASGVQELDMRILKSLFSEEVRNKYKFKFLDYNRFNDLDFTEDVFNCKIGTDS